MWRKKRNAEKALRIGVVTQEKTFFSCSVLLCANVSIVCRRFWYFLVKWNWATIDRIEVFVLDHFLGRDTESWIVHECLLKKVHSGWIDVFDLRCEIVLIPARECCLVVGQRGHARPNLLSWCTEDAEHTEELIDFRVSLEQWFASCHFSEDASDGPDVNGTRVSLRSKEDFRCAVYKKIAKFSHVSGVPVTQ